jgi:SAM-dependent methyltransferase
MSQKHSHGRTAWPKTIPTLTAGQSAIREDFMNHWLQLLPNRYGVIELINHRFAVPKCRAGGGRTLEVGAGRGAHLAYEDLCKQEYTVIELRAELACEIQKSYPGVHVIVGDIQQRIEADDASFDRILAIHVIEHLPNLPAALKEIKRLLKPDGVFGAVIPCEGGAAYTLARNISARRIFEGRYGCSYDWFIESEHVNNVWELRECLEWHFPRIKVSYWPLLVPSVQANLVLGVECRLQ